MKVRLEVTHSKANVKRVVLTRNTVIGRAPECNLRIAAGQISRKHCEILVGDAGVRVRDLGSSNGTFVGDERIEPYEDVPVPPGSALSVGGVRFVVRYELADSHAGGNGSTVSGGQSTDHAEPNAAEKPAVQETVAVDSPAPPPAEDVPSFEGVEAEELEGLPVFDDGFDDGFDAAAEAVTIDEPLVEGTIAEFSDGAEAEAGDAEVEASFPVGSDTPTEKAPEEASDEASPSEDEVEELTFEFSEEDSNVGNSGNLANFLNNLD